MRNPFCLRCRIVATLPTGFSYGGFFTVNLVKRPSGETLEQSVSRQLADYQRILSERVGGNCKVKIVEPCKLAQECGGIGQ